MSDFLSNEPMLDVFVFETAQNIEQLEKIMLTGERRQGFAKEDIDEIFRIMHTIKGSASMMSFGAVAALARIPHTTARKSQISCSRRWTTSGASSKG